MREPKMRAGPSNLKSKERRKSCQPGGIVFKTEDVTCFLADRRDPVEK